METICNNSTLFFICLTVELPQIVFITPSLSVYPGETVQLFCKTDADSGHNFGSVTWLNESDYVMSNSSILTIPDIKEESSGIYTCRSTNIAGSSEKWTSVQVLNPPEWVAININRSALINDTVVCPICTAGLSDPPSRVNWTLNRFGRILPQIENTTSIQHTNEKDGFVVQNRLCFTLLKSQHDGLVLNCDVFYSGKKVKEQSVLIEVKYPPYLNDNGLAELMIARHRKVQLSCPVIPGRPYGTIEWLNLDGKNVGIQTDNTMEIIEREFTEDRNIFCCRKNQYGGQCFTFNATVVSPTQMTSLWPESYYPKQADFVTFNCKIQHDRRNPASERDVHWDVSKLGSAANHNWTMRRESMHRVTPYISISRLTVLYTHSLFGQNISCLFRQPYQLTQQKKFSFAHVIEPPVQVWFHKLQLSTTMFWHWSGNYQIRHYMLILKHAKNSDSRQEVLRTGETIICEESEYMFTLESFGSPPENHLDVIIQACDNFSCSVPSFVYQIYNRFVQNGTKNDKGEDGTATINNEYVVNANTNAVLTFQQGPTSPSGRGVLTVLIYSCVLVVFVASLLTSAFAFCLLHKFGKRRNQSALTCQSVLCENQYQLPSDDQLYFQRSAPYTCTLEVQRPENHGTLSRKIQFV